MVLLSAILTGNAGEMEDSTVGVCIIHKHLGQTHGGSRVTLKLSSRTQFVWCLKCCMWYAYSIEDNSDCDSYIIIIVHILYVSGRIGWLVIRVALTRGTSIWVDGNREKTIVEDVTGHTYTEG